MIFTFNRVITKIIRHTRDETPCSNCGAYSGSSKLEPVIEDRAEMLDPEDMAW
ncbi:hypothetical protein M422DRAFT_244865 [Sphaerobolus stellatus SS14]|nr:hypothetical protein M422DRAFT_244865 [Sphaerobolus stellatus SS14]